MTRPFSSLLVANRGEIAVRILRSARAAGLRTVAIYSDADRTAPHVLLADAAVRVGPTPAAQSYLSIEAVLGAAARSGAEAIHPGYGFLSERAEFARAVAEAGLVFVGPPAEVIAAMGRKDQALAIAERAGVPVVPRIRTGGPYASPIGVGDPGATAELAQTYPVLVKPAAGGGGKGMRIVRDPAGLAPALEAARREAAAAFGDDTLLVERYLEHGRHVEVQVLADNHGNVVHLFERDCSVQRRHQKVLEESPAPTISDGVRERLTAAAVALAREVGYVNAGTVEFLVDGDAVYFLEMNTRLQVEHPVTELVTGLDLVQLQLEVAAGERLPFQQGDLTTRGHAIEARIYAEDPYTGFLPQAGTARVVRWPHPDRARVDAALESGQLVTTAYDPLLGKIIVHGATRETARRALVSALDETAVIGLRTNVGFLRDLVDSAAYEQAAIHTGWLDSDPDGTAGGHGIPDLSPRSRPVAAWVLARLTAGAGRGDHCPSPFGTADGWRLGGPPAPVPVQLRYGGTTTTWQVDPVSGQVSSEHESYCIRRVSAEGDRVRLEVDGAVLDATVAVDAHTVTVVLQGQPWEFERPDAFAPERGGSASGRDVVAPMPGTVLAVDAAAGDEVASGQRLGLLEAMKMELALTAPHAGTLVHVGARPGDQVALGHVLFSVEAETAMAAEEPR